MTTTGESEEEGDFRERKPRTDLRGMMVDDNAADEDQSIRPEELQRLREDAQKALDEAVAIFQTSFRKLPKIERLSQLWKERRIEETDPIWLMVEALSLMDARSQLQLAQIVKLYKAHDDMSRYTAQELRQVVEDALMIRDAIAPLTEAMEENSTAARDLTAHMVNFNALAPELLELVATAIRIQGKNNRLAKWEQALICAACTGVGAVLMFIFK